ncbi:LysM peptidoglycan-binding domain-containing protein, partial [Halalkalibacter krulwichiae]
MEMIKHQLTRLDSPDEQFALTVHLDPHDFEFASELDRDTGTKKTFLLSCKKIIDNHYPTIKVSVVRVVVSGLLFTTIPYATSSVSAQSSNGDATVQANSIFYEAGPGDSLWTISRTFNTTVELIKRANHLTSDIVQPGQRLIIPKAFHTVAVGEYLSILARNYGTTTAALREANHLSSDTVRIGQTLVIPTMVNNNRPSTSQPAQKTDTYTVKLGDSLSVIARQYGTTTEAIRKANHLSSDLIRAGQVLAIPSDSGNQEPTFKIQPTDQVYTVVAGDHLSLIASRFDTTVEAIRQANHLTSNTLQIGQRLVIPGANLSPNLTSPQTSQAK